MSVSKWDWRPICDTRPCPGDCDLCGYEDDDEEDEMKYIIMCGGNYTKWERPRQLLEIHGEPIIARTVRLLKENGINPLITSDDPEFGNYAPVIYHENKYRAFSSGNNGRWTDCFFPSDEPVCYIFGDVVFSPEAIQTIVETETDDIEFFASAPPFDRRYIKPWAEPFALKVVDTEHLKRAIKQTEIFYKQGYYKRKPIMWELWQVIQGYPFNEIHYDTYVNINDYTCDVDSPEDLKRIEQNVPYTAKYERICE